MNSHDSWQSCADATCPSCAPGLCEADPSTGWRAPLCDMASAPGGWDRCLLVHLCWCFPAGEIAERVGGVYAIDCCIGGVCGCLLSPIPFYFIPWAFTRKRLRELHAIPGSLLCDCVVTACLPPCALAQALTHLDVVGTPPSTRALRCAAATPPLAHAATGAART